jgi:hypothetical protein
MHLDVIQAFKMLSLIQCFIQSNILIHLVLSVCLSVTRRSAAEPAIGKSSNHSFWRGNRIYVHLCCCKKNKFSELVIFRM